MIYGIYKDKICAFDTEGVFVGYADELPPDAVVYNRFSDLDLTDGCISFEYLYWVIERTHYRGLENANFKNVYSEHAFTRQFRNFVSKWGRCTLDSGVIEEAKSRHNMFYKAQQILNKTALYFGDSKYSNKYMYGTASGRFTNVSNKKNLLAISKKDRKHIVPLHGYFVHLDMKAFHFSILRHVYGLEMPSDPYDRIVEEKGVTRNEAKILCLRWMNVDSVGVDDNPPSFIRDIRALRLKLGVNAKQFNYDLQTQENRIMCGVIVALDGILDSLGLTYSISNYCYDSISIDCTYKTSRVINSLFTDSKYYTKVLGDYPFTFSVSKGIF